MAAATTVALLLQAAAPLVAPRTVPVSLPEPLRIVLEIQASIDRDGGKALERVWRATLRRRPREPQPLLAVATFERNRYNYQATDSLLLVLERLPDVGPAWRVMGMAGRGVWRSLGSDVPGADSLLSAARTLARSTGRRDLEAETVLGLMQVRQRVQGPRVARQLLDEWWALLSRPTAQDSAQQLCQRGVLEDQLGDTTGTARVLAGARASERLKSWRVAGNCRLAFAQIADRRGYPNAARDAASAALAHFRRIEYTLGIATAGQWYGYTLLRAGNWGQSKERLEESAMAARRTRFESVEAWASSGLAELYLVLGDLGRARTYAKAAKVSHERRRDMWGLASSLRFEGAALAASGDHQAAAARYLESLRAYDAARLPILALQSQIGRVAAFLRLGQLDSAERAVEDAERTGRASDAWRLNEGPQLRAMLALRRNRLAEAESLLRTSEGSKTWREGSTSRHAAITAAREAQVALRMNRMAVADSALERVTAAMDAWRRYGMGQGITASLAQLRDNWGDLAELYPDLVTQLSARNRVAGAFEFVERNRAREVVQRRLRSVALVSDSSVAARALRSERNEPAVVTLRELQQSLSGTEAFVSYVLGIDDAPTTAFVVTRDTVTVDRMPGVAALGPDIRRFLQLAVTGTEAVGASERLGNALLVPVFDGLPSTITRLIISPDGELHRIPFDALRLPDGRYALERATFSVALSATSWLALRATSPTTGNRIVAVGNPSYRNPGTATRTGTGRAAFSGLRLPRLPYSGDEARRVAAWGRRSTLLTGALATERALETAASGDAAVVHVAAHGLVDDASEFNTALAVTPDDGDDGFITPDELSRFNLHGPLVVLSACRSSGGQVLGGEGLRGITAPLLEAGARAVVGTHWSIGDRSVIPFIDRFYRAMSRGMRADDALRDAKLAAIRANVSIADWGSYTVTGDASIQPPLARVRNNTPVAWLRSVTQSLRDSGGR